MSKEKFKINPDKINNPFALGTVFLIVLEALLGYWLIRAEDSSERIVAGSLMTLILILFMVLIYQLSLNKSKEILPQTLNQNVTPASKEVSVEEMKIVTKERISGPEGTFTISAPPSNWKVMKLSLNGLIKENLDISDTKLIGAPQEGLENILLLKSNSVIEGVPIPGKTIINGVVIPTALITKFAIQLSIVPMERLQPPFYTEFSFEHNVYNFVGSFLKTGVIKLVRQFSGEIKETNRDFLQVDMIQVSEHMDLSINGTIISDCPKILSNITIIAIKGDIIDHMLMMHYPSIEKQDGIDFLQNEIDALKHLVSSFSPLKIVDPIKMINEIKTKGKAFCQNILKENGQDMFLAEFFVGLKKVKELNPNNEIEKKRIITILKPFKKYSKLVGMKDDRLSNLWKSLEDAEKGNSQNLLLNINQLIADIEDNEVNIE